MRKPNPSVIDLELDNVLRAEVEAETAEGTFIHPLAAVESGAQLGNGVRIGPFAVVEDDVILEDDVEIQSHAVIKSGTWIGARTRIFPGAVLGGIPQAVSYHGEETHLRIGHDNLIREFVTIHKGTGEGNATMVGNENMLMAYAHVGHDCVLGDRIQIANSVGVSGHVVIEDDVTIGGMTGIHQFVRIGRVSMIGGYSRVVQDCPPFMISNGRPAEVVGHNVVGLRRHGVPPETREAIKMAYRLLYRSRLNSSQAIERIEKEVEPFPEILYLIDFLKKIREGTKGRALEREHSQYAE